MQWLRQELTPASLNPWSYVTTWTIRAQETRPMHTFTSRMAVLPTTWVWMHFFVLYKRHEIPSSILSGSLRHAS
ncbi:hypothetical protein RHOFW510R12_00375 [Rhodanobacter sp. FW510-R12]|nr:hypothetical protein RHOFW104R8_03190 [Rhodanobacter sp. FW104-R8]KZC28358.1 hypothetical protein RhoFW510T8_11935 [Rhodanobacter sp. FW510-T8]KZC32734.1 hypothetical protein RhoFW510R10_11455 [Rhodanobacter sp. FW510-R10]